MKHLKVMSQPTFIIASTAIVYSWALGAVAVVTDDIV